MKAYFEKTLAGLRPWDDRAQDFLRKIKPGKVVEVEIKRARNPGHHRKYWALINLVWTNQDRYPTKEALHYALKIAVGHVEWVPYPDGQSFPMPKKTNFGAMDQDQFEEFYSQCIDKIMAHFLPGVTEAELRSELLSFAA